MSGSRRYDNRRRREAAQATQQRIIEAAGRCFCERGYAATTLATVAERAEVSVESIKKSIGTKRALLRRWFDQRVAGDEGVPIVDQAWLRELSTIPDLAGRVELAAGSVAEIMHRSASAVTVMTAAAHADAEIAGEWARERSARYTDVATIVPMILGDVTPAGDIGDLVDSVYALTEAQTYLVLVEERGWTPEHYRTWLSDIVLALILPTDRSNPPTPEE